MAVKLTRLTHKIAIQLHLVAESFTICSSRSGNFWIHSCISEQNSPHKCNTILWLQSLTAWRKSWIGAHTMRKTADIPVLQEKALRRPKLMWTFISEPSPGNRALPEKSTVTQLAKKSVAITETVSSLPWSEGSANEVYILSQLNPVHIFTHYLRSILTLFSRLCLRLLSTLSYITYLIKMMHLENMQTSCTLKIM
jgi:hypothetical protein